MITSKGELDLRVAGKLFIVKSVQYEECPSCGEKILSPDVSQKLYKKIEDKGGTGGKGTRMGGWEDGRMMP